jgi:DNA ligase-associated metallophosphoesterase
MQVIEIAGTSLVADASGALFWPDEQSLLVADLHLEKASSYARRRVLLPPYDSAATLARLVTAVERYAPRRIVALGDSFHEPYAEHRIGAAERARLSDLQKGRDWIWIAGNHDPHVPEGVGGQAMAELRIGPLVLRHEPSLDDVSGEIAGHLHPVAHVHGPSGSVRRRCFVADPVRCIMPAFGAFAGGLNFLDEAFAGLFGLREVVAFVLGRDRVHPVAGSRCLPDGGSYRGFVSL